MQEFNVTVPIGSIYENRFSKPSPKELGHPMSKSGNEKLVEFVAYCVNPNHFHFILEQVADRGIEKFMQRLGNGYTKYFNGKYKRSGVLFQGKYKSIHVGTNEYLLRLSAYVNLNDRVHFIPLGHPMSKSSWEEYMGSQSKNDTEAKIGFCKKDIVLGQFSTALEYQRFANEAIMQTMQNRAELEYIEYNQISPVDTASLGHRMSKF